MPTVSMTIVHLVGVILFALVNGVIAGYIVGNWNGFEIATKATPRQGP